MRPGDRDLAEQIAAGLFTYERTNHLLLGIRDPILRMVFVEQLLESIRRVKYFSVIRSRKLSERSADPNDEMFDPLKASILHHRKGQIDEAFWLIFLFVHFGKHNKGGWRYVREVYGRLGDGNRWDWASTSVDPIGFREWLTRHLGELQREGVPHGFGNHRKYESLNGDSSRGTGAAVESYVHWVDPPKTHENLINQAYQQCDGDSRQAFDLLYQSMKGVVSFGRTARFDYLTTVGNLGLGTIEPGFAYLQNSTGPILGARLLFSGQRMAMLPASDLESWLAELSTALKVGMQVLEDALCNWQKSPGEFKRYRG